MAAEIIAGLCSDVRCRDELLKQVILPKSRFLLYRPLSQHFPFSRFGGVRSRVSAWGLAVGSWRLACEG